VLRRTTFDMRHRDGSWSTGQRETCDRGNGATVLLYDVARRTVLLTRQFRFPATPTAIPTACCWRPPRVCWTTTTR
jgi:hypothetical protein